MLEKTARGCGQEETITYFDHETFDGDVLRRSKAKRGADAFLLFRQKSSRWHGINIEFFQAFRLK